MCIGNKTECWREKTMRKAAMVPHGNAEAATLGKFMSVGRGVSNSKPNAPLMGVSQRRKL